MDIRKEANKLKANRLLETDNQIDLFEGAIENILNQKNPKHIELLFKGFDNNSEEDEVMFGLIHAIEEYDKISDPDVAMEEFAKSIPKLVPHADKWLEIMIIRILNDEDATDRFGNHLVNNGESTKAIVRGVLNNLTMDDAEQFEDPANIILAKIK